MAAIDDDSRNQPTPIGSAQQERPLDSGRDIPSSGPGRYGNLNEIGSGSTGEVFLADDRLLGRQVVLKIQRDSSISRGHSLREEGILQSRLRARTKHVVPCLDYGFWDDRPYVSMEQAEGSLAERVGGEPHFGEAEAIRAVRAVARAALWVHKSGYVHDDIKPGNVMLGPNGQYWLGDFSAAYPERSGRRRAGGTPGYRAPGCVEGRRRDLFPLGVILAEALLAKELPGGGRRPAADAEAAALVDRGLAPDLADIVVRCLSTDPRRQYRSAGRVAADLKRALRRRTATWRRPAAAATWLFAAFYFGLTTAAPESRPALAAPLELAARGNDSVDRDGPAAASLAVEGVAANLESQEVRRYADLARATLALRLPAVAYAATPRRGDGRRAPWALDPAEAHIAYLDDGGMTVAPLARPDLERRVALPEGRPTAVALKPGAAGATVGYADGRLFEIDPAGRATPLRGPGGPPVWALGHLDGGKALAVCYGARGEGATAVLRRGREVWRAERETLIGTAPDGGSLITAVPQGSKVRARGAARGAILAESDGGGASPRAAYYDPERRTLVAAWSDRQLRVTGPRGGTRYPLQFEPRAVGPCRHSSDIRVIGGGGSVYRFAAPRPGPEGGVNGRPPRRAGPAVPLHRRGTRWRLGPAGETIVCTDAYGGLWAYRTPAPVVGPVPVTGRPGQDHPFFMAESANRLAVCQWKNILKRCVVLLHRKRGGGLEDRPTRLTQPGQVSSLAFSPGGRLLVTAGITLRPDKSKWPFAEVWDVNTGRRAFALPLAAGPSVAALAAVSPAGRVAAVATTPDLKTTRVALFDIEAGGPAGGTFNVRGGVTALRFSPDGDSLLVATSAGEVQSRGSADGRVVWKQDLGRHVLTLAVSAGGRRVLAGTKANKRGAAAGVWDLGGFPMRGPANLRAEVRDADVSPGGRRAVVATGDGRVIIWDLRKGGAGHEIQHRDRLAEVGFGGGGRWVVSIDRAGVARFTDAATGRRVGAEVVTGGRVLAAKWGRAGDRLWVIDGRGELRGHPTPGAAAPTPTGLLTGLTSPHGKPVAMRAASWRASKGLKGLP